MVSVPLAARLLSCFLGKSPSGFYSSSQSITLLFWVRKESSWCPVGLLLLRIILHEITPLQKEEERSLMVIHSQLWVWARMGDFCLHVDLGHPSAYAKSLCCSAGSFLRVPTPDFSIPFSSILPLDYCILPSPLQVPMYSMCSFCFLGPWIIGCPDSSGYNLS